MFGFDDHLAINCYVTPWLVLFPDLILLQSKRCLVNVNTFLGPGKGIQLYQSHMASKRRNLKHHAILT